MRLANVNSRAALVIGDAGSEQVVDIAEASNGELGPDLPGVYDRWADLVAWAPTAPTDGARPLDRAALGAPSPRPRQTLAVGLNYSAHAAESGFEAPTHLPPVFPKFVSAFTGPDTTVVVPTDGHVDWEVELVVVIGKEGHRIAAADAWDHVAGLTVGQDLSERVSQLRGPAAQFGLGKSLPGFAPQGPWLTTPDEVDDRDAFEVGCSLDGEVVQQSTTREMIFPVAELIAGLSEFVTLYPGDVIFTGTPDGVGLGREPQRWIQPGETLHTWISGLGELNQTFVAE